MQAEKQQQQTWKITVQAKTKKSFNFKFKSTQVVPTWKFHRFSLLIKLRNTILRVKMSSESTASSVPRKTKATLKSKLLRIFKKFGIPRIKNRDHPVHNPESQSPLIRLKEYVYKEPFSVATLCTGVLVILMVAALSSLSLLYYKFYTKFCRKYVLDCIGKASNFIAGSGLMNEV